MTRPIEQAIRHLRTNIRDIHAWKRAHNIASRYGKAIEVVWRSGPFQGHQHVVTDVYTDGILRIGFVSMRSGDRGGSVGLDLSSVVQYGILNMDITDKPPPERPIFPMREHAIIKLRELVEAEDRFRRELRKAISDGDPRIIARIHSRYSRPGGGASSWGARSQELATLNRRAAQGFNSPHATMEFVQNAIDAGYAVGVYVWGQIGILHDGLSEWYMQLFRGNVQMAWDNDEPLQLFVIPRTAYPRNYNPGSTRPWRNVFFRAKGRPTRDDEPDPGAR